MVVTALTAGISRGQVPHVNSTARDFFQPGTQPGTMVEGLMDSFDCGLCHGGYNQEHEPFAPWAASSMGVGSRDPIFWAALAVAEQEAPHVGDLCRRCHAPRGWTDLQSPNALGPGEGISCALCHRMVDPVFKPGSSPVSDLLILAELGAAVPTSTHTAQYVLDTNQRPRGPYKLTPEFFWHEWEQAGFARDSRMCGTCHDVSNPLFTRDKHGRFVLNEMDQPHPTQLPYDGFPLERTYSEWSRSEFARGPVEMGGRFGGNQSAVSTCQDCHMPRFEGLATIPGIGGVSRPDVARHDFRGATNWMLQSVRSMYTDMETGLTDESVSAALSRNREFMQRASDLYLAVSGNELAIRVVNQTGHKLPTGQLDGRRIWLDVRFFNASGILLAEHGAYDPQTGVLTAPGAKVYQAFTGLDQAMAAILGVAPGPSPLFPLNNMYYEDNRIPPRGFTNRAFKEVESEPVAYTYRDGQYWDNTRYPIPPGAVRADVHLYYQTITKEVVEYLRDVNVTNNSGQVLYDQWVAHGKGPPVDMAHAELNLLTACRADYTGDGRLTVADVSAFLGAMQSRDPRADFNDDGAVNGADMAAFVHAYRRGCPPR
jgi:hypothetical protein